jgi:hypothetical protein
MSPKHCNIAHSGHTNLLQQAFHQHRLKAFDIDLQGDLHIYPYPE